MVPKNSLFNLINYLFISIIIRSQPVVVDSPGRSGARFFMTSDKMYIIKTMTSDEVEQMHALLKEYHPVCMNFFNYKSSKLKIL